MQLKSQDSGYTVRDRMISVISRPARDTEQDFVVPSPQKQNNQRKSPTKHTHTHRPHTNVKLPIDLYIIADFCFAWPAVSASGSIELILHPM